MRIILKIIVPTSLSFVEPSTVEYLQSAYNGEDDISMKWDNHPVEPHSVDVNPFI